MIGGVCDSGLLTSIEMAGLLQPWGKISTPSVIEQPIDTAFMSLERIAGNADFGIRVAGPVPVAAAWLSDVTRRIRDSIVPEERRSENQGQWLNREIAISAITFFELTSDVLPGEPHIYSALSGDFSCRVCVFSWCDERGDLVVNVRCVSDDGWSADGKAHQLALHPD